LISRQGKEGAFGCVSVSADEMRQTREANPMTNSSFFTADRSTHLKIVVVSLLASIVVMAVGIAARPQAPDTVQATVYKPQPVVASQATGSTTIR
jgi:hypothetical protein